ncbi:MAG: hypothetical protein DMG81_01560 [Acidobacteria bacterium]|nr:MAG: hypothetical protein DMG81_01560 [Acidobacteriota bacterium]
MVAKGSRSLVWVQSNADPGWACSSCQWKFAVPTFLGGEEAKSAYDRLAAAKFHDHLCEPQANSPTAKSSLPAIKANAGPSFADRARKLIKAGYKPKDAVELVTQEIVLEHRDDRAAIEQAQSEAENFLLQIRKGLI